MMKKILTTFVLSALVATAANAQAVLGYTLSESQGVYTPLTDATVIFDAAGTAVSNFGKTILTPAEATQTTGSSEGYSIGFDINIGDVSYSSFLVSGSGYVYLGNGDIEFNASMQSNFMTYAGEYNCFGLGVNRGVTGLADTKISYKTTGNGDDARLIVQFEKLGLCYNFWDDGAPVDFQLIIDAKGKAQIVFSGMASLTEENTNFQLYLGLRHGENYVSANGEYGSLTIARNNRQSAIFPPATPDGATVSFITPTACVRPLTQPTDLELTATSDKISGTFAAASDADNYIVLYTTGDATAGTPVDGTTYKADEMLGGATVAYVGPLTDFSLTQMPGGTDYCFTVYAMNAYGLDGPVYNTTAPLTATVATCPAPAEGIELLSSSLTELSLSVNGNEAGDEVVVLYTDYCERDNFGDHGLFGEIPADVKVGDVLPAPEDFTPEWNFEGAPMPENAGTVAYIGKAGENFTIENLQPGTGYYLAVFTRNDKGVYTSRPYYTEVPTYIDNPYSGDSYNFPCYRLPAGWTTAENGAGTFSFRAEPFWDRQTLAPSQGSQVMQFRVNITRGDAVNGKETWLTTAPVIVNERHVMAKFDYCIVSADNRFSSSAYNDWAEGDILQIRLSEDNGETWTVLTEYNDAEHPAQEETLSYVSIAADLNEYRGKTVLVQLYWKTFANPAFGINMYIDRVTLLQGEFPAVPEVSVGKITHDSAVASWISQQTDYQLVYSEAGSSVSHVVCVEGASSYTLEGLRPNTEYSVKVRGLLAGGEEAYSEWSDPVVFTTADYPAVDAPEDLVADTDTFASMGYVQLSWGKAVDALSYEVAYRLASSTEWTYKNCEGTSLLLTELESGRNYVWKVRAFCTYDRETSYSAQARFTAPQTSGVTDAVAAPAVVRAGAGYAAVEGAQGAFVAVYSADGVQVARTAQAASDERYELPAGLYIVAVGNKTHKVAVK